MSWLKKFPWLSLLLVLLTYAVFGWFVASESENWRNWLLEQGKSWNWGFEEGAYQIFIHVVATFAIISISLILTAPIAMMTYILGSWMGSDAKAILSILVWSFVFVLMIRWFEYFIRFLVLLSAAILGRLELQTLGYNKWQTFTLLTLLCLLGFALGVFAHLRVIPQ
jgi:hypothetical protein